MKNHAIIFNREQPIWGHCRYVMATGVFVLLRPLWLVVGPELAIFLKQYENPIEHLRHPKTNSLLTLGLLSRCCITWKPIHRTIVQLHPVESRIFSAYTGSIGQWEESEIVIERAFG